MGAVILGEKEYSVRSERSAALRAENAELKRRLTEAFIAATPFVLVHIPDTLGDAEMIWLSPANVEESCRPNGLRAGDFRRLTAALGKGQADEAD